MVTSIPDCAARGALFRGANSSCNAANCPRACPCDWTADGILNEGDIFAFTNDHIAGRADYDNDGVTTDTDMFEFVDCVVNRPTGCM